MSKTKRVKNISKNDLSVVGIGIVKAGEIVTVPVDFNNANFKVADKIINNKQK